MSNKFSGKCYKCGISVAPGEGRTWRFRGRWYVACRECSGHREALVGASEVPPEVSSGRVEAAEVVAEVVDSRCRCRQCGQVLAQFERGRGKCNVYGGLCAGCFAEAGRRASEALESPDFVPLFPDADPAVVLKPVETVAKPDEEAADLYSPKSEAERRAAREAFHKARQEKAFGAGCLVEA